MPGAQKLMTNLSDHSLGKAKLAKTFLFFSFLFNYSFDSHLRNELTKRIAKKIHLQHKKRFAEERRTEVILVTGPRFAVSIDPKVYSRKSLFSTVIAYFETPFQMRGPQIIHN
jgi:hypothetical protein